MTTESEKKIIVDEDWKTQVEREKERLRQPEAQPPQKAAAETAEAAGEVPLPPPDLLFLASTLYMQALVALGLIANPATGESKVQLNQAKHAIDTLQMLQEKTAGNRTAEESSTLDTMLHELRMAFVTVGRDQPVGK